MPVSLLEPLFKASSQKAQLRDAARKRYVELLKQYTYSPESINAKSQAEFHQVATELGIEIGAIQKDLNDLSEVKRLEAMFARHIGLRARQKKAEEAIAAYREETRRINQERQDKDHDLVIEHSHVLDDEQHVQLARKELHMLKNTLGDLAQHVSITFTE